MVTQSTFIYWLRQPDGSWKPMREEVERYPFIHDLACGPGADLTIALVEPERERKTA